MQKKACLVFVASVAFIGSFVASLSAQTSAFTYQGKLNDAGVPANGTYDLRFTVYDAATNGNSVAISQTNSATSVSGGLFAVQLNFGPTIFDGSARWLDIGVRTNGNVGAFTSLTPRQSLTSTPYAIQAANASTAVTANIANSVASGGVALSALAPNVLNSTNLTGTIPDNRLSTNVMVLKQINVASSSFAVHQSVSAGIHPRFVVAADVDGDGVAELITQDTNRNFLTFTNGDGFYSLSRTMLNGVAYSTMTAVDLDEDGMVELIGGNEATNYFSIFTNLISELNGGARVFIGSEPKTLTMADVNADGRADFIATDVTGTVTVMTNTGRRSFVFSQSMTSASYATVGDVDGDGRPDLICVNGSSGFIYHNNGSAFSTVPQTFFPGANAGVLVATDINHDGTIDLIVANTVNSAINVATNVGGSFGGSALVSVGGIPSSIVAMDVNSDGRMDLITTSQSSKSITVLTNVGTRVGFGIAQTISLTDELVSMVAADVSGDAQLELITATASVEGPGELTIWMNEGRGGTFTQPLVFPNVNNVFSGSGSGLFGLNANNLANGTVPDNRLSTNVVLRDANQSFTGINTFNNVNNSFAGNGSGLTALSATQVTMGNLSDARLSANVALRDASQNFTGVNTFGNVNNSFAGNGSGLTALSAGQVTTGTLADARLSGNVARLDASQMFTGTNTFQASSDQAGLRLTSGTNGNIVLQTLTAGNSGFQSVNFNGYYAQGLGENRYNTNKARWRMLVDQRNSTDVYTIDVFNGTSLLNALILTTNGNLSVAGTVNGTSDKNVKTNFASIDVTDILEKVASLPLSTWVYKTDDQTRHVGPMAQDFYSAFGLGTDDKHIATVDADGVALAAIQGLNQKLEQEVKAKQTEIADLQKQNQILEKRLENVERLLNENGPRH